MASLRSHRFQRIIALLLLWCFAFGAAEAPIADVHDGDAPHTEVDRATGASHADHEVAAPDPAADRTAPAPVDHPVHVCHCTHAHGGVIAAPHTGVRASPRLAAPAIVSWVTPPAFILDPPTHPPTA